MGRHITIETALRSHPKFKRLRRLAGLTERDALGALASLWMSVREVSADGLILSWDADDIDEAAMTPGLCQHLVAVGFIEFTNGYGHVCHDWMDHSGNQCKDAERKRLEREAKARLKGVSTDCPRTVPGASALEGKGRVWEGNGKEESSLLAVAGATTAFPWDLRFEEWWKLYRKGRKQAALKRWRQISPRSAVQLEAIMVGTARYLQSKRVREGFKQDAENFLSKRGWDLEEGATEDEWARWEKGGKHGGPPSRPVMDTSSPLPPMPSESQRLEHIQKAKDAMSNLSRTHGKAAR
jgi:hypothetical protein